MKEIDNKVDVLTECQKEFLFNSKCIPDLSMPQQYCSDYDNFPKKLKHLCKYTNKIMHTQIPDKMHSEDVFKMLQNELNCMSNEICKDCEYYDFLA